ncbi:hypothetical protein F6X40_27955 [Paraburkholderia sp. UCT31]|uniref:hypothetical protein n=1 Tax=Paraburkholderia sp. UCT31 TaxID=2615209 RepID=UPI001655FC38|nr:hypothetical protein [Paraburkholderia sp. UCT31]MBC8740475.1 hypothetical protein [Paraburkholderia sp. UCT31]
MINTTKLRAALQEFRSSHPESSSADSDFRATFNVRTLGEMCDIIDAQAEELLIRRGATVAEVEGSTAISVYDLLQIRKAYGYEGFSAAARVLSQLSVVPTGTLNYGELSVGSDDDIPGLVAEWLGELRRAHEYLDKGQPFFSGRDCAELARLIEGLATQALARDLGIPDEPVCAARTEGSPPACGKAAPSSVIALRKIAAIEDHIKGFAAEPAIPTAQLLAAGCKGAVRIAKAALAEAEATPVPAAPERALLLVHVADDEMAALQRFWETSKDGEAYDVAKPMMRRLTELGLVRRTTRNIYGFTAFGLAMVGQSVPEVS